MGSRVWQPAGRAESWQKADIYAFMYEALAATLDDLTADQLVALTLKTSAFGVKAMALLDAANTNKYGNPEITEVNISVKKPPTDLGHDQQTKAATGQTGIQAWTYTPQRNAARALLPAFRNIRLCGQLRNAWWADDRV
jgi:hydroxylamine reductase